MRGQSKTQVVPSGEAMAGDRRRELGFRGRGENWGDSGGGGRWGSGRLGEEAVAEIRIVSSAE